MEEVFSTEESCIGVGFGLVVVFCFFCGTGRVGVGDMEWNVFRFLGGRCCFSAAAIARIDKGHGMGCRASGMILRGMGGKWKSFIFNWDPEDRLFIINWDHDCFVVDVNGVKGLSWSPSGPVELDVEVSTLNKGSEEVELIVVSVHADEDDSIVSAQGEDGRGGESCAGEFMID